MTWLEVQGFGSQKKVIWRRDIQKLIKADDKMCRYL